MGKTVIGFHLPFEKQCILHVYEIHTYTVDCQYQRFAYPSDLLVDVSYE